MKPTQLLRVALEGEEEKPTEDQKQQQDAPKTEETPAVETSPENPVPTDADRQAKLDATQAEKAPAGDQATATPTTPEADGGTTATTDEEETETGQKKLKKEDELVFYGKLVNFAELKAKAAEYQEQYEVKIPKTDKNAIGGRIRVRKIVKGQKEPKFILTTKTKLPDGSEYESDCKTTEENFIQFKYFCEGGMIKDRYTFPVEGFKGLKWEIDVFTGTNGLFHEWVKIDLEREESGIELANLPPFPVQLTDVITNQNGQRTPEEEAIVRTLYDTVFRTPNPIISKK